ncbi:hypothetical protein [Sorangium sp. So ce1153]|uniref:hypothetical protein n=1 Tax=Sorangium sp. So ce1153 TaxID=3133333 RepID=UPI003F605DE1
MSDIKNDCVAQQPSEPAVQSEPKQEAAEVRKIVIKTAIRAGQGKNRYATVT